MLKSKISDELFKLRKLELVFRLRNKNNLDRCYTILDNLSKYFADSSLTTQLVTSFLNRWKDSSPATLHKYIG